MPALKIDLWTTDLEGIQALLLLTSIVAVDLRLHRYQELAEMSRKKRIVGGKRVKLG